MAGQISRISSTPQVPMPEADPAYWAQKDAAAKREAERRRMAVAAQLIDSGALLPETPYQSPAAGDPGYTHQGSYVATAKGKKREAPAAFGPIVGGTAKDLSAFTTQVTDRERERAFASVKQQYGQKATLDANGQVVNMDTGLPFMKEDTLGNILGPHLSDALGRGATMANEVAHNTPVFGDALQLGEGAADYATAVGEGNTAGAWKAAGITAMAMGLPMPAKGIGTGGKAVAKAMPTLDEYTAMVKRGKIQQAMDDKDAINAVIRGKKPATDLDLRSGHPLAGKYETGALTDRFAKAGLYVDDDRMGRVFVGRDKATVEGLKNAKNPTDYGRAYGYSEDDIAHFYTKRAGGNADIGYQEWLADNYPEMAKGAGAKAKKMAAAAQKEHDDMWSYVDSLDKMSPEEIDAILAKGKSAPGKGLGKIAGNGPRVGKAPPKRMTELPTLRGVPVNDAIKMARKERHLIPSSDAAEGGFIGGPRNIKNRKDLLSMRRGFDKFVARDPRGGDWYDRYRAGVTEVTGGNPVDNLWMSNKEGQFSAGVDPGSELHFALKDTNSAIATGTPVKAARPAQQQATIRAIEAKDPTQFQLGKKTGEYARRVNPDQPGAETATGVNDFRHARNLGYTEPDGSPQRGALGDAAHTFSDHETALAVDRANKRNLGGRSNWTGEQLQAAPWVVQKADDLFSRGQNGYRKRATKALIEAGSNASPEAVEAAARELAFQDANRTIADFFPKHTAYGTYEAQPGPMTGHLPGSVGAPKAERDAYAMDPRSAWNTASGGRDAIYAGYGIPGTGENMRVRPTQEMQGVYTPPGKDAVTEYNMGGVARPLVTFEQGGKVKTITAHDRALLDGAENTRAYIDAQGAGAWHKPWTGGQAGKSNSMVLGKIGAGPMTPEELQRLKGIGASYGLPDVVDTNEGVTMTRFYPGPPDPRAPGKQKSLEAAIRETGLYKSGERAKVDSGYMGFEDEWQMPQGEGHVTRKMFETYDALPKPVQEALDRNPAIAAAATARLLRDEEWASKWGAPRADIQNARRIMGAGPGGFTRLRAALARREVLPAAAAAIFGTSTYLQQQEAGNGR